MMKKILTILLIFLFANGISNAAERLTYKRLINAMAEVESGHNPNVVSKNKQYVGYLQISKICVREANNIVGYQKYNYDDRFDKDKSIEIFLLIQKRHNPTNNINLAMRLWSQGLEAKKYKFQETNYTKKVMKLYYTTYSYIEE